MRRDLTGQRFGRLVVTGEAMGIWYIKAGRYALERRWRCCCDCGEQVVVFQNGLASGDNTSCGCRRLASGEDSHHWKGAEVSYSGAHKRVRATRGPASDHPCSGCGAEAKDWAYRWNLGCSEEQLGVSRKGQPLRPFCTHIEHYDPMCRACHTAFDTSEERGVA